MAAAANQTQPTATAPATAVPTAAVAAGAAGKTAMFDAEDKSAYDTDIRQFVLGYDDLSALCVATLGVSAAATASGVQRVLCVGSGTGQEVMALARAPRPAGVAPLLSVVGVDPAAQMVAFARKRVERELTADQRAAVEFVNAYLSDVSTADPKYTAFDAVTSVLVMHFLPDNDAAPVGSKQAYLASIAARLKPNATLFLVDACADTSAAARPALDALMDVWMATAMAKGASAALAAQKKKNFLSYNMVPAARVEALLHGAGFVDVMPLYKGFMYTGFKARYVGAPKAGAAGGVAAAAAASK